MNKKSYRPIILTLGALTAIGPFSIDMYLPGFPSIASDLHTSIGRVGLSLTSYFIGISFGQLIYGPLLDRFGRKKPLIIGLLFYILSAILCGISPNINLLIASRLLLALGACVGIVASRAIVRDLFPADKIAGVFSLLILIMAVAPIIAPSVGGFVTTHLGWRFIFFILGAIALLMLWAVWALLPESRSADPSVSLKLKGISANYWAVLSDPQFVTFTLTGGIAYAGMFAYLTGAPFVFMNVYGLSESQFGIIFSLNAIGLISGSQLNRVALKRYDSYKIASACSYILMGIALLLFILTMLNMLNAGFMLCFIFSYLMMLGLINPNVTAIALMPFSENAGSASALMGSIQMIFGALASAMVSFLFNGTAFSMVLVMLVCSSLALYLVIHYQYFLRRQPAVVVLSTEKINSK